MKDKLKFYINGQWVESESNEKIEVINPANESIVGHVTAGTKEDIDSAVEAASDAFETYQFSSKEDRIEIQNLFIRKLTIYANFNCSSYIQDIGHWHDPKPGPHPKREDMRLLNS